MAGIPRSPRGFCGNLWVTPTTALLQRRTTKRLGYPPVGLFDASDTYHAEEKGNRLPRPERRGLRSPWGHEVSAERRDRKKTLMAERTKRSATPKMGAQGIQFQTGRSIIARVGLPGSYKTITGTFLLPAILLPSQS